MCRWFPVFVLSVSVLLPLSASAKGKKPKPLVLEPLAQEIRETSGAELTKHHLKVLRNAGRCLNDDKFWVREMENRDPVTQIYETLSGAVVCWQDAEKKGAKLKLGEEWSSSQRYISTRTRYVESLRSYFFALSEKLRAGADVGRLCARLKTSLEDAVKAKEEAEGLNESFQTADARALAEQLMSDVWAFNENIAAEYGHQKCE
jgi:hypothetical protein